MALTRITKGVIKPNENYDTHNINSTGIITAVSANFSGNVTIGGTLTYEDVTSVDVVGVMTATGADINGDLDVAGVSTFAGDLYIAENIIHTGDTDTKISFPSNDTIKLETGSNYFTHDNNKTVFQKNIRCGDFVAHRNTDSLGIKFFNAGTGNNNTRIGLGAEDSGTSTNHSTFQVYRQGSAVERVNIDNFGTLNAKQAFTVAGISTFSGNVDINADLDVDGHTELDNGNVSGVVTFTNSPNAIQMNDDARVSFGTSLKTSIAYNTSASRTIIRNYNDTLEIGYRNVELHHINQARLTIAASNTFSADASTTFTGTSFHAGWYPSSNGGTFKLNDNARLAFGSNSDTNLFHNNSHFYLQNTTGNIYVTGNVVLNDDLDVVGNLTISNNQPEIFLQDTNNNSDFKIQNVNGVFKILDATSNNGRFNIASDGTATFTQNLNANAGLDVTGNITATGDINLLNNGTIFGGDDALNTLILQSTSGNNNHSRIDVGVNEGSDNGGLHFYTAGSTIATRRMTIKGTSGKVGIGTNNPGGLLTVYGSPAELRLQHTGNGSFSKIISDSSNELNIYTGGGPHLAMTIDGNQNVGIGTNILDSSANLSITDTGSARIYLKSGNTSDTSIYFGRLNDSATAAIRYEHSTDAFDFYGYNNSKRLTIDSSGRLLVNGATNNNAFSGGDDLIIGNSSGSTRSGITIVSNSSQDGGLYFSDGTSVGNAHVAGQIVYDHDGDYMRFFTDVLERLRITSDGFIGINDITPYTGLTINKEGDYWDTNGNTYAHPEGRILSTWRGDRNDNTDYWVGFVGKYLKPSATVNILLQPHVGNFNNQAGMYIAGEATGNFSSDFTLGKIISGNVAGRGTTASSGKRATKSELIRVTSAGKVGINETSPQSIVDVRSEISPHPLGAIFRKDYGGDTTDASHKLALTIWGQDHNDLDHTTQDAYGPMIGFGARTDDAVPNTGDIRAAISYRYNGQLTFHTEAAGSVSDGSNERLRIDGYGRIGINNTSPSGRSGGSLDITSNDNTTGHGVLTDQRGRSDLIIRNKSGTLYSYSQLMFTNGNDGFNSACFLRHTKGGYLQNENYIGDLILMQRVAGNGSANPDFREKTTWPGGTTKAKQIWWANGTGQQGNGTHNGWHHFAEQNPQGNNEYQYFTLDLGSASYSRAGLARYTILWNTGHASGTGHQTGEFRWFNHHGNSTCNILEHIILRRGYNNGSYYGWNDAPLMKLHHSSNSGNDACIHFKCQGRRSSGYDMGLYVTIFLDLYAPKASNGNVTPTLRARGYSAPSDMSSSEFTNQGRNASYVSYQSSAPPLAQNP